MTEIDKAEVHSGRKPIPKRKRFEVFKRDGFQCVYCGAKPPGVALHVDHVEPVVKGGTNETSNLVTACAGCNLGKGAIKLTENGVAALKTRQLAYQREIAEVDEAYNDWVGERRRIHKARVNECSAYWAEETGVYMTGDMLQSLSRFLDSMMPQEVMGAMDIAARKFPVHIDPAWSPKGQKYRKAVCQLDSRFRYFCGICWKLIKGHDQ
jgi:5-methylcytosine-specific restriction endonuclease McrA